MMAADKNVRLEADLAAARAGEGRGRLILIGLIALIAGATLAQDVGPALAGSVPSMGRTLVGAFGVIAAVLLWRRLPLAWQLAMAWAVIQIPVYAWSPEGSPNVQALTFHLGVTNEQRVNRQLVAYSQVGVNLVGIILAAWFYAWRDRLAAERRTG